MSIALVSHTLGTPTGSGLCTTSNINTTGSNLIVAICATYQGNLVNSMSDSKSNTWLSRPHQGTTGGGNVDTKLYYCINPTTDANHNFTGGESGSGSCVAILTFSGAGGGFDVDTGGYSANLASPGSITPGVDNEVLIASFMTTSLNFPNATGIGSSFTFLDTSASTGALSTAYQIQTTATTRNPAWTGQTNSGFSNALLIASFKISAPTTSGFFFLM